MPTESLDEDVASALNAVSDGWNAAMGLRFVRACADEVVVEWDIASQHLQPYGIVHGGVHAGVIETIASVGAAVYARPRAQAVVGLENHTSFLHAVRGGLLRATARPLTRGRQTQVWEGTITDAAGRIVATGRVRLLCLEPETALAGKKVEKTPRVG
jgi:1,4-dihydroxy-2-naphthoyl-CoA hydrolase